MEVPAELVAAVQEASQSPGNLQRELEQLGDKVTEAYKAEDASRVLKVRHRREELREELTVARIVLAERQVALAESRKEIAEAAEGAMRGPLSAFDFAFGPSDQSRDLARRLAAGLASHAWAATRGVADVRGALSRVLAEVEDPGRR